MAMLILLVTTTIIASFVVEILVHLFRDTYEIEWPQPVATPENALALDIVAKLRQAAEKMNGK